MIITKQLDIQGSDKTSSVSASTPRNNLVKELEKYSRHTEPAEKRTTTTQSTGTSQGLADTVAAIMSQGPVLISKSKVNKPVAKDRPNILSKRPRYRPQQRSSSTESSSSTSSLVSQALNLSGRLDPAPDSSTRFLGPEETPISAEAALAIPNPSIVKSTAIPTPSAITVSQKGVEKLLVPVTATDIFPATSDDVVIPTGNGYVVYKPAEQVAALLGSASLGTKQTSVVSSDTSNSAGTQTTFSTPLLVTSLPLPISGTDSVVANPPPYPPKMLFPKTVAGAVEATCVPPQYTPSTSETSPTTFLVDGIGVPVRFQPPKIVPTVKDLLKNKLDKNSGKNVLGTVTTINSGQNVLVSGQATFKKNIGQVVVISEADSVINNRNKTVQLGTDQSTINNDQYIIGSGITPTLNSEKIVMAKTAPMKNSGKNVYITGMPRLRPKTSEMNIVQLGAQFGTPFPTQNSGNSILIAGTDHSAIHPLVLNRSVEVKTSKKLPMVTTSSLVATSSESTSSENMSSSEAKTSILIETVASSEETSVKAKPSEATTSIEATGEAATSSVTSEDQKLLTPLFPPAVVTTIVNTYGFNGKTHVARTEVQNMFVYYKEHLPPYYVTQASTNSSTNTVGSRLSSGSLSGVSGAVNLPKDTIISKSMLDKKDVVYYQRKVLPESSPKVIIPVKSDTSTEGSVVKIPILQRSLDIKSVVLPVNSTTSPLQPLPISSTGVSGQNSFIISQPFSKPIVMFAPGYETGSPGSFTVPVSSSSALQNTVTMVSSSYCKEQGSQSRKPIVMLSTETSKKCLVRPSKSLLGDDHTEPVLVKPGISLVPHTDTIDRYPMSQTIEVQAGVTDSSVVQNKNPVVIDFHDRSAQTHDRLGLSSDKRSINFAFVPEIKFVSKADNPQ